MKYWSDEARKQLVGKKVVEARYLTKEEMVGLGWNESVLVLIFEDGTMVYPSQDDEGNGGGAFFGQDSKGKELRFPVIGSHLMGRPTPVPTVVFEPPFSGPLTATHKNMLKRIKRGDRIHLRCYTTLDQLKDLGFVSMMAKQITGRVAHWKVLLTEKGQAA